MPVGALPGHFGGSCGFRGLFVHPRDLFQVAGREPVRASEHRERDLPRCGLAFQPSGLDPQLYATLSLEEAVREAVAELAHLTRALVAASRR